MVWKRKLSCLIGCCASNRADGGLAPTTEGNDDGIVGGPRTPQQIAAQRRLQQTQAQVDEVMLMFIGWKFKYPVQWWLIWDDICVCSLFFSISIPWFVFIARYDVQRLSILWKPM